MYSKKFHLYSPDNRKSFILIRFSLYFILFHFNFFFRSDLCALQFYFSTKKKLFCCHIIYVIFLSKSSMQTSLLAIMLFHRSKKKTKNGRSIKTQKKGIRV